jgi:arylsulfatase A-like enzyme
MTNKILAFTGATLLVPLACTQTRDTAGNAPDKRPNVVFIVADDLGYGDLSCYGQEKFQTPNIDRLALNGMRFTQFYSGATVSAPSRCNLVTGMHTGHAAIRGNQEVQPEGQWPLPAGTRTIFSMFKEAGYATGAFGKWGLGFPGSEGAPENQGVDVFFGYNCQRLAHNYYPAYLWHNDQKVELPENDNGAFGVYSQDLIQEHTLRFIENHKDKPFFLYVPCILPHAELLVPEDSIIRKFRGLYPETPFNGMDDGPNFRTGGYCSQAEPKATFAAMVYRLDVYVGQIIEKLKEEGLYENTLIFLTSDNGPHREGGADPDFFNSNGIFRGYKRDLYEGGIRVPMIVSWHGRVTSGTESDLAATFWDMMPTFSEIIGTNEKPGDGLSILPTLTGQGIQKQHAYLYFEFLEQGGKQAVRKGNWKLIHLDVQREESRYELYNIAADPSEVHNVIALYPAIASELKTIMANEHTEDPLWPLFGSR